jgi:hypothetical protein
MDDLAGDVLIWLGVMLCVKWVFDMPLSRFLKKRGIMDRYYFVAWDAKMMNGSINRSSLTIKVPAEALAEPDDVFAYAKDQVLVIAKEAAKKTHPNIAVQEAVITALTPLD